jgi:DNA-binding NtrC family response regulator
VHSNRPTAARERSADILPLAEYFLEKASSTGAKALSGDAIKRLLDHPWPGNARELRNAMERVSTLVRSPIVEARDLGFLSGESSNTVTVPFDLTLLDGDLNLAVESLERTMILRALEGCAGNRAEAARRLSIHRQLLYSLSNLASNKRVFVASLILGRRGRRRPERICIRHLDPALSS